MCFGALVEFCALDVDFDDGGCTRSQVRKKATHVSRHKVKMLYGVLLCTLDLSQWHRYPNKLQSLHLLVIP